MKTTQENTGGNVYQCATAEKHAASSKKELPYDHTIPLLSIYAKVMKTPKGCLSSQAWCSVIHNSQGTVTCHGTNG